ncbi:ribonuclease H-like domain-containing protein [Tanacetum coccineum]
MAESAKRHEENSNIIKEIRACTDAVIRNQGASIKTLEIQIGQMSKVLQERGFGSLPSSTETNPRDQVKSISTAKADFSEIRRIGCEAQDVKILDAYDHTLPQKEKDLWSFTLPYFIHNIYFDKALVDLGASMNVMPFSTYTNLGLGILSHTRYKYVNADLLPSLFINLMSKSFYYSIIKNKDEGKSHAGTLINIPVFVRSFSIITGFTIIDGDDITKYVVLGMKFCKKYASCQMIMKKFALGDKCERIMDDE